MHARVRAHDWSQTPLGPIESWPQSLKMAVTICLDAGFAHCIWWGPDLIQIYNDAAVGILRAKHPTALGQPARECWAKIWPDVGPLAEHVIATGEPERGEGFAIKPDRGGSHEQAYFDFCFSATRDGTGNVAGLLVTAIETTGRARAEAMHRGSEARFRLLATVSADAVYRISADWREMHNLDGKHFIADTKSASDIWLKRYVPEEDRPRVRAAIQKAIDTKSIFELLHRFIQENGEVGWMFSRAVPLLGAQGEIEEWIGSASDITKRKRAEEALRESEEQYRTLFESIDEGFCIIEMLFDADGKPDDYRFLQVNPAFERQTGLKGAVGRSMKGMVPEHEAYWFEIYGRIALTGEPERFENRAGALGHWYEVYAFRVGRPEERRVGVLFNDILDRKRAEAALREREAQLQQASRAKDEFLAMLGHELRNPLQPIVTTLQLMQLRQPDALADERAIIKSQVRHMVGMVDDLLDVSRIARGKVELNKTPLEIGDIVARASETARPLIEECEQTVETAVADELAVDGDRRRLVQVVTNLLTNAAKYSPPGRTIYVSAGTEGSEAVIRVRDQGIGIDPALLPRIFDSFTQDTQSLERSQGGLGLGLAIVQNLTAMHGGRVEAHSEGRDQGSEFVVRLPLIGRQSATKPAVEQAVAPKEADKQTLNILIVDDYTDAAESLAMLFEAEGHRTRTAQDGLAALAAVNEFKPDLALIDIGLPAMDGYELARRLRQLPELKNIPLIALTGYGQQRDRQRTEEAGFNEHIVKPVDPVKAGELIEGFANNRD
jgi:PAS domain S-box-containing protein